MWEALLPLQLPVLVPELVLVPEPVPVPLPVPISLPLPVSVPASLCRCWRQRWRRRAELRRRCAPAIPTRRVS